MCTLKVVVDLFQLGGKFLLNVEFFIFRLLEFIIGCGLERGELLLEMLCFGERTLFKLGQMNLVRLDLVGKRGFFRFVAADKCLLLSFVAVE